MNLINPFEGITDLVKLDKKYRSEKRKAMKLYGSYQVKKVNWLLEKATQQRNLIEKTKEGIKS